MSLFAWTLFAEEVQLETDSVTKDYKNELPRIAPTEPQQVLSKFQIIDGFRIELAAHEPLVTDPISMAFDEFGRLYVVCMNGYSENDGDNLGVIRRLEDTDNDGTFDAATDFLTGLSWPTAIACYDGGVFLAAVPNIAYCKDTDGDGIADEQRTVFTGFARHNVQGMLNSFRWGLDNRLYGASGLNGGQITSAALPDSAPVNLRGRDYSIDPATMRLRPESGGAQHGATFDRWGERFVCSNSDHLQWVEFDDRHLRQNPLLQGYRSRRSIAIDGGSAEVYRTSAVEPWRIVRTRLRVKGMVGGPVEGGGRASGYFTSASGVTAYSGDAFPAEYQNNEHFFVGDVGSNLVHLKRVDSKGLEMVGVRATPSQTEFLTSTDNWFRPVQFANGPDGSLYVIDMYREVIEHPLSLPPMIKQHLDLTSGRDRGRIYRITTKNSEFRRRALPGNANEEQLVAMLGHPNGWHRETAARLIVSRCARSSEAVGRFAPLLQSAIKAASPHARIRAIYCLHSIDRLSEATLLQGLADRHPQVRRHALKVVELHRGVGEAMASQLERMVNDSDELVRYQLTLTLGAFAEAVRREPLTDLATRAENRKLQFAILSSMGDDRIAMLRSLLAPSKYNSSLLTEVVRQVGQGGAQTREALALIAANGKEHEFQLTASLLLGVGKQGDALTEWLSAREVPTPEKLVEWLVGQAKERSKDESLSSDQRLFAVRCLRLADFADVGETLEGLLSATQLGEMQNAAVEVLGGFVAVDAASQLIAAAPRLKPIGRRRATELLVTRPSWAMQLLESVAAGNTSPTQISALYRDKLIRHRVPEVSQRAQELLGRLSDRASVVSHYQSLLDRDGDPARGKLLFRKVCSSCHQLEGIGKNVGPDLAPLRNRGASYLLTNILDPNREVDPRYEAYSVITSDGRTFSGLLTEDTATSIRLTQADGSIVTVLKQDIDELQATGRSLMPEGLEKDLGEQGMADVIAWIIQTDLVNATDHPMDPKEWKFGVARTNITPKTPMLMSGYASRETPATGKLSELWAKALVVQDAAGQRGVLITVDLIGIGPKSTQRIRNALAERYGVPAEAVMICCSHTHTGPAIAETLAPMNFFYASPEQRQTIESYTHDLESKIVEVVGEAIGGLQSGTLAWGNGRATFATNRRENAERKVPSLRVEQQLLGPFDHDVPVLAIRDKQKSLRAVVFGYACHATVLSSFQWSGDYPGFAQAELEKLYPDCVAMFWAGCGADQNPLPRRSVELAQHYGRRLAVAVEDVLLTHELKPIVSELSCENTMLDLAYAKLPTSEDLERDMESKNKFEVARAKMLKSDLETNGALPESYPYPIARWQLGDLEWLFLGGEVVVDYAIRLKSRQSQQGNSRTWVAAYANDVMAYIPSERVLREGRYEGGGAMIYYGLPSPWAAGLENQIIQTIDVMRSVAE